VWPGLSATAAAHPDVRQAAQKAILEQAVSGVSLANMLRGGTGPRPLRPQDIRRGHFLDHACYYLPPRQKELAFLQNARCYDPKVEQRTRPVANLAELVARLTDGGMEVVVADLTPPDVASASFYVVRAIAIGMQPLTCGFAMECRGSERLRRRKDQALNPVPHPFC
jgi:ribosomal protein S12 methylthiotransferase accessory factor